MIGARRMSTRIDIILASNPHFSHAPGIAKLLESQADFKIIARPERAGQLFSVMDERIASVLVVVAGFYSFPAIAQVAARSNTAMVVLAREAAEGQIDYLREAMKRSGVSGEVFDEEANPAEVIDCIRKVSRSV